MWGQDQTEKTRRHRPSSVQSIHAQEVQAGSPWHANANMHVLFRWMPMRSFTRQRFKVSPISREMPPSSLLSLKHSCSTPHAYLACYGASAVVGIVWNKADVCSRWFVKKIGFKVMTTTHPDFEKSRLLMSWRINRNVLQTSFVRLSLLSMRFTVCYFTYRNRITRSQVMIYAIIEKE